VTIIHDSITYINCPEDSIIVPEDTVIIPDVADLYVSPTGTSGNSGSITSPVTLQRAWELAVSGDLIYVRGGSYNVTGRINLTSKTGITIKNYPGEKPVFDAGNYTPGSYSPVIEFSHCTNCTIVGIRVTNMRQSVRGSSYGFHSDHINNCLIDQCEADHIAGPGFCLQPYPSSTGNTIRNCDSHHNDDYNSASPHDGADGFVYNQSGTSETIRFVGCRAWLNSDDGYDLNDNDAYVTMDSCWAIRNGYYWNGSIYDHWYSGTGIKLGKPKSALTIMQRMVRNCLSAYK
jgi:hypothetical protein